MSSLRLRKDPGETLPQSFCVSRMWYNKTLSWRSNYLKKNIQASTEKRVRWVASGSGLVKMIYSTMQVKKIINSNNSIVLLLVGSFLTVSGQGEFREWTPPFGRWTTLSTVHMTKINIVPTSSSVSSVCDEKCCKCENHKSRIECTSSHHCNVSKKLQTGILLFKKLFFVIGMCSRNLY
jgi:hypothetical protein